MNPAIPREIKPFASKATSEDYNKFTRRTFFDITQLFNIANQLEGQLKWVQQTHSVDARYTELRLTQLRERVAILEEQLNSGAIKKEIILASDMLVDEASQSPAIVDNSGTVTIPPIGQPVSKLYLKDSFTGEVILPSMLNIVVDPLADDKQIQDTDIKGAVKNNGLFFWQRKVTKSNSTYIPDGISAQVVIDLPEGIITNRDVNYITVSPYPEGMLDITAIEYNTESNWTMVPGFEPISDASNLKLLFPPIAVKQIRFTFKQRYPLTEGSQKVYYLGARNIGIFNASYENTRAEFLIPITLKGTGRREIIAVKPDFVNSSALTDTTEAKRSVFNYTTYEIDDLDNPFMAPGVLPVTVEKNKLLFRASINKDPNNGTIPALRSVEIQYRQT